MEWGPRALGARSILADPTDPEMKDILNAWVKHREEFRPFAPSVMEESAAEYFACDGPSPYMTVVYRVRDEKRSAIPALTHVDGTARVQTVSERDHPRYYRLIKQFKALTGVPMLVNTSFNVMGEPVVCTPEDAIRCFYGTGIDRLVIGNFIVTKAHVDAPGTPRPSAEPDVASRWDPSFKDSSSRAAVLMRRMSLPVPGPGWRCAGPWPGTAKGCRWTLVGRRISCLAQAVVVVRPSDGV